MGSILAKFDLRDILRENKSEYYRVLSYYQLQAEKCLESSQRIFPEFTNHSVVHCENVISNLNLLVAGMNEIFLLNDIEIFILLMAAYFHDLGMSVNKSEINGQIIINPEDIRKHHELIGEAQFINFEKDKKDILGNPDHLLGFPALKYDIGKVIKGHRKHDLQSAEYENSYYCDERVRIRLLAALLRLADELDILPNRAKTEYLYGHDDANEKTFISRLHHYKHYYVQACIIEENGSIKIYIQIPENHDYYKPVLKNLIFQNVYQTVYEIEEILIKNGIHLKLYEPFFKPIPGIEIMPEEVWEIAKEEYSTSRNEVIRRLKNEVELVVNRSPVSGSVVDFFDPTRGVNNE